jgi:hypothetical protein
MPAVAATAHGHCPQVDGDEAPQRPGAAQELAQLETDERLSATAPNLAECPSPLR